jgi:hypothetical protein
MNTSRLLALSLASALTLATAAHAQTPPPPPPPGAMGGMGDHDQGPGGGWMQHHQMHEAARLKAFHDALNIRPDQEAAFDALAESMKPEPRAEGQGAGPGDGMREHQAMAAMTAPERLDMMAHKMDEHISQMRERFQRHATAVKTLYAQLSSEQRRTFDARPGLLGHHEMMGGDGPHHGMEPGMHPGHAGEGQ